MLGPEVPEHGFQGTIVAEIALAQQAEQADPGRERRGAACAPRPGQRGVTAAAPAGRPRPRGPRRPGYWYRRDDP